MAQFRFRLQSIVAMREAEREQSRREVAELLAAEHTLRDQQRGLEQELGQQQNRGRTPTATGRIDVRRLAATESYVTRLRARLHALHAEAESLGELLVAAQQVLLGAEREVRVLEKLRERQLDDFRRAAARAESKQLDEVAARGGLASDDRESHGAPVNTR